MNLRLAFTIAWRYIFSKKSANVINWLSYISMGAMGVGAFALVVILSVFNGFEGLVKSLYNVFHADIRIEVAEGKVFEMNAEKLAELEALPFVEMMSRTLEENAYFRYGEREYIGMVKGVDANYGELSGIDGFIAYGDYELGDGNYDFAVCGYAIDQGLNLDLHGTEQAMTVFVPKRKKRTYLVPEQAFNRRRIYPRGVFAIQQEFDEKYVIAPLGFVRDLLNYETEIGALEIRITEDYPLESARKQIAAVMGEEFMVLDKYMQNQVLYNIMKTERWMVVVIVSFALLIISFNIIGSLYMLVLEKKKDIAILQAMGATTNTVRNIFLMEGLFTGGIGATIGIILGLGVVLAQMHFGIVPLPAGVYVIDSYPVELVWSDVLITFLIVLLISVLASWYPARRATRIDVSLRED